jgi:selenide,water dikinase
VTDTLESVSHTGVFAAGDVASVDGHSLPKSGVVAVRQAPVLAHNLRGAVMGTAPRRYRPQRQYLSLISTGDQYAVGARGRVMVRGRWVWRVKDVIDRRFVRRYNTLRSEPRS